MAFASASGACLQSFLHLGKFQPAEMGKFQPAQTGEFSTGTDSGEGDSKEKVPHPAGLVRPVRARVLMSSVSESVPEHGTVSPYGGRPTRRNKAVNRGSP
jgi:hypothetical protein